MLKKVIEIIVIIFEIKISAILLLSNQSHNILHISTNNNVN